ncbi:MAG: flagellar assembly protein FliW [Actinomycetaceae bacterium]|nr:flagellar assembly protein FliW [Actinomycetaceae bacterium]
MSNNDPEKEEEFPALRVRMVTPMPGLETHLTFDLAAMDESGVLWTIKSVNDPAIRLFAVPPIAFFDGYVPRIPRSAKERLQLKDGEDPFILVIIHPAQGPYPHTANLLAPLVLNPDTLDAMQVVLEDQDWPLQAPIGDPKDIGAEAEEEVPGAQS